MALIVAVAGLSAALLFVQSVTARRVISESFGLLEQEGAQHSVDQAVRALETDLDQLVICTRAYAEWDYSYEYINSRDKRFIDSNLTPDALENMHVDLVWMVDSAGVEVLSLRRDASPAAGIPDGVPAEIVRVIRAGLGKLLAAGEASGMRALVQTRFGLLAVAASKVVPTSAQGEARGTLVFGRFLNQKMLERAQNTSQLGLHIFLSRDSAAGLPAAARALWSAPRASPGRILIPAGQKSINGYQLLRDINEAPVAVLEIETPRHLVAFGQRTGHYLIGIFSAVIGLFALAVGGLLLYLEKIGAQRTASERRYRAVITQAQETMLLVDTLTRRILEANPAATTTLGFTMEELTAMDVDELFYACDGDVLKPVHAEMHVAASSDRILIVRCSDNQLIDVEVTANPLIIDGRDVTSFVLRDVSARRRAERLLIQNQDRLAHLAHHDMLTGLLNRLGLERRLAEVLAAAARSGRHAAFLYIDLDHFKKINDLRGHACGDKLLQLAAQRLQNALSFDDLVVRMGGDEFVVVAVELRDVSSAGNIAARIRDELSKPFEIDGQPFKVTTSIGVSIYPDHGESYELLLKNADIALYESKEGGRDGYTLFSNEMTQRVTERLALEVELREALRAGQFYLDYQPLVDPKTQRIASLEALIRWHHPIRGRVPPLQFISIAERSGQICDIGAFVIREACRQIGEWQRNGARTVPVAVNVSSKQLEQASIVEVLREALETERIDPTLLRIEITESVFMDESEQRVRHLNQIRAMGVAVSVDDFGTGYSNLAYLKHLPIDCLKIDRAFVRDLDSGNSDEAIVRAIIHMAKTLGLATVAEGVETQEQARRLGELGANYVQGFYFSPPLAADACGRLLQYVNVEWHLPEPEYAF